MRTILRAGLLSTHGAAEIAALAAAFNEMAQQLSASREAEWNFLLSGGHELKTPLTAVCGYAEGLAEGGHDLAEVVSAPSGTGLGLAVVNLAVAIGR